MAKAQEGAAKDAPAAAPLGGLRVVDLSTWIGGAYCTKLLADGGAEVIKVESPEGDPLRRWSASGAVVSPDDRWCAFQLPQRVEAERRCRESRSAENLASLEMLLASADAVVWSRGSSVAEHAALRPREILGRHPHLTVTTITPFGLEGPWSDKPATEFTLQAWSGAVVGLARGRPDRAPVFVGGQIGEWVAGVFGAIGTLAAGRRTDPGGELVDVSMLEALAMSPHLLPRDLQRPARPTDAPQTIRADTGCRGGRRRAGRSRVWDRATVARLLRHGGAPRVDGGSEAVSGPHGAGADHRRMDRSPHRRGGRSTSRRSSGSRTHRSPTASNVTTFEHFRERETFVENPRDGAVEPAAALPARGRTPTAPRSGPSARWAFH